MEKRTTAFQMSIGWGYLFRRVLAFLLLALSFPAPFFSQAGETGFEYNMGPAPLEVSSQAPGQSFRFSPVPSVHEKIVPGSVHLRLGSSWANIYAREPEYELDYEILHTRLSISYGVNARLQLAAAIEQKNFFGGGMDSLIIEFHDLFGIEQGGRTDVPRNVSHYLFRDAQGNLIVDSKDVHSFDNNNIQAEVSYVLSSGTKILPAVNLKGVVCREIESPLKGDGDPYDLSLGMGLSKRWSEKWYSYHNIIYTRYGLGKHPYFTLSKNGLAVINALVWQHRPRIGYLIQLMYAEGMFEDIPNLSDATHEAHIGLKWEFKSGGLLEFAFIENVITYDNSPDFGIHLAYTYTPK